MRLGRTRDKTYGTRTGAKNRAKEHYGSLNCAYLTRNMRKKPSLWVVLSGAFAPGATFLAAFLPFRMVCAVNPSKNRNHPGEHWPEFATGEADIAAADPTL
jgi:hypothetical protein